MKPADATVILHAIDAAIASLTALRTVVATLDGLSEAKPIVELAPAVTPVQPLPAVAPAAIPVAPAAAQPAHRPGKGPGRPRKHFVDRLVESTGAERVAFSRAARRVAKLATPSFATVSQHFATVSQHVAKPSFFLSDSNYINNNKYLERKIERETEHVAKLVAKPDVAKPEVSQHLEMPLPADWAPDGSNDTLAKTKLGDIGAANLLAKFRRCHATSGVRLTPTRWQNRYGDWIARELAPAPGSLPLMRVVSGAQPAQPPTGWQARKEAGFAALAKLSASLDEMDAPPLAVAGDAQRRPLVKIAFDTPQWKAWTEYCCSVRKTPPSISRWGEFWPAPSEWPPGHAAAEKEAATA